MLLIGQHSAVAIAQDVPVPGDENCCWVPDIQQPYNLPQLNRDLGTAGQPLAPSRQPRDSATTVQGQGVAGISPHETTLTDAEIDARIRANDEKINRINGALRDIQASNQNLAVIASEGLSDKSKAQAWRTVALAADLGVSTLAGPEGVAAYDTTKAIVSPLARAALGVRSDSPDAGIGDAFTAFGELAGDEAATGAGKLTSAWASIVKDDYLEFIPKAAGGLGDMGSYIYHDPTIGTAGSRVETIGSAAVGVRDLYELNGLGEEITDRYDRAIRQNESLSHHLLDLQMQAMREQSALLQLKGSSGQSRKTEGRCSWAPTGIDGSVIQAVIANYQSACGIDSTWIVACRDGHMSCAECEARGKELSRAGLSCLESLRSQLDVTKADPNFISEVDDAIGTIRRAVQSW